MALRGRAFLAIWHDIAPEGEDDYNEWHTRQHMPERLGVPGFLLGRRYVDWSLGEHRWFTLYEAATLETFASDGYRARLNSPTRWSGRVQPHFRNFVRSACVLSASVGRGIGGALATLRLDLDPAATTALEAAAGPVAHRLAALPGVTGAHLGVAAPAVTGERTREAELRGGTEQGTFGAVVMLEGTGRAEVTAALPAAGAVLREALTLPDAGFAVYDLAYALDPAGS